jgi:peptidoglycan/xylan/chitin deacetylase (PgdA/CDA1 family)
MEVAEVPPTAHPSALWCDQSAHQGQLMFTEFGYSTIMWSVDPQDWRRPGVSVVTSRLVNGAHPGAIMLAHDIHPPTITAVPADV